VVDTGLDVVTGALSYTGLHIAVRLLDAGRQVRTLTGHPERDPHLAGRLDVRPYAFDDPVALAASLSGATTLYNTYWVRFSHGPVRFEDAVANSQALFTAARRAGVQRIVHVSITNPSIGSSLPYFRGKALVEQALAASGVAFGIVRPTVVFGPGDVLINNIAWLLRHLPIFAVAGDASYRVRPVHVDDVARLCVDAAATDHDVIVDAVGPESFTFTELVHAIGEAVGTHRPLVHLPLALVSALASGLGAVLRDELLTRDELVGLMQGLVDTDGPTTGHIDLRDWLREVAPELGRSYASELDRHFNGVSSPTARAQV
jgi:nucleoside-diphosphate-sugar epimerase